MLFMHEDVCQGTIPREKIQGSSKFVIAGNSLYKRFMIFKRTSYENILSYMCINTCIM